MEGNEFFLFLTAFFYGASVGSCLNRRNMPSASDPLWDRRELREFAGGLAGLVVAFILSCILSQLRLALPQQPAVAWVPVQQQEVDRKGDHDEF